MYYQAHPMRYSIINTFVSLRDRKLIKFGHYIHAPSCAPTLANTVPKLWLNFGRTMTSFILIEIYVQGLPAGAIG